MLILIDTENKMLEVLTCKDSKELNTIFEELRPNSLRKYFLSVRNNDEITNNITEDLIKLESILIKILPDITNIEVIDPTLKKDKKKFLFDKRERPKDADIEPPKPPTDK